MRDEGEAGRLAVATVAAAGAGGEADRPPAEGAAAAAGEVARPTAAATTGPGGDGLRGGGVVAGIDATGIWHDGCHCGKVGHTVAGGDGTDGADDDSITCGGDATATGGEPHDAAAADVIS